MSRRCEQKPFLADLRGFRSLADYRSVWAPSLAITRPVLM